MIKRLKADLHTHTSDDPRDRVAYSAEMLIDQAHNAGVEVLAITCHEAVVHSSYYEEYARRRDMVLVPAIEQLVEGKHVLILNPSEALEQSRTFEELRANKRKESLIIAPHPFHPMGAALRRQVKKNHDIFDALEYHSFYFSFINPNKTAQRVARRLNLPLIGSSDTHTLPYIDSTYSWIDVEVDDQDHLPSVLNIIQALRKGRVETVTRPRPFADGARMFFFTLRQGLSLG